MHTLTLRIYLTVVAVLLLFAFSSGWLFQRHIEEERVQANSMLAERVAAWADLIQRSLPGTEEPVEQQAAALHAWSHRLRLPLALDDVKGQRIAASDSFLRRQAEGTAHGMAMRLEDGRTLWVMRPGNRPVGPPPRGLPPPPREGADDDRGPVDWPWGETVLRRSVSLVVVLVLLFFAVAAGAWPAVRRLTRRLKALQHGVENFGAGNLGQRVEVSGRDEVAAVAASFNQAAGRIEALVQSHRSLLANASHELRSPLARMKMAVSMLDEAPPSSASASSARSTPTSPNSMHSSRRCCSRAGSTRPRRWACASRWKCWRWPPRRPRVSTRRPVANPPRCSATNACCAARCATCWRTPAAMAAATWVSPCRPAAAPPSCR